MFASLKGQVTEISGNNLTLEVNGVGYLLTCPLSVLEKIKVSDQATIYTHLYVREDALNLYGFLTAEDKEIFTLLLSISGVGPKAGINILSMNTVKQIKEAITQKDLNIFTRVSGIGKRTAERIIIDLKGKIDITGISTKNKLIPDHEHIVEALKGLGYKPREAQNLVASIPVGAKSFEEKIKVALRHAGRPR